MRTRTVLTGLAVIGLLAACGSNTDSGSGTTAPATDTGPTVIATPDPSEDTSVPLELTAGATVIGLTAAFGTPPTDATAGVVRTSESGLIAVVTFGSSTCPQVPDSMASGSGGQITVSFPEPTDGPCTLDYVPATTIVALPDGGDTGGALSVTIGTWGTATLPTGSTDPAWITDSGS